MLSKKKNKTRGLHSDTKHSNFSTTAKTFALAGFLLVAFALFLSQALPVFAKAAPSQNIRGTIVLSDKPSGNDGSASSTGQIRAALSLPGSTCTLAITACTLGSYTGGYGPGAPALYIDGQQKTQETRTSNGEPCTSYTQSSISGMHTVTALVTSGISVHYMSAAYDCSP